MVGVCCFGMGDAVLHLRNPDGRLLRCCPGILGRATGIQHERLVARDVLFRVRNVRLLRPSGLELLPALAEQTTSGPARSVMDCSRLNCHLAATTRFMRRNANFSLR